MLKMLQPRASSPPSAKKSACTARMAAMTRKPAYGPSRTARMRPPPRWPLDPVPGMVKFSIWQAKMKAPITPMSGTSRTSFSCLTLRAQSAVIAAEAAHMVQPTAGEMKPSAICMMFVSFYWMK